MDTISISTRLRPIRFGFLVKPDDGPRLRQIFEINTCLWGGRYNPIIPHFQRVPNWWERNGHHFLSSKQIINGYLDFFEPDFIVEAEKGLATGLGIDPSRIVQMSRVLLRGSDRLERGIGLSVLDLYRDLYQKEFQFSRRIKHNIVDVIPKDKAFANLSACLFGAFPRQQNLKYFYRAFQDAFSPEKVALQASTFEALVRRGFTSALKIGSEKLEVEYNDNRDPILFIFDASKPRDLLDLWNLRAIHRDLLVVPIQWLPELSGFFKKIIERNFRPLPGNPNGVMIRTTALFSRSISTEDIEPTFKKYLMIEKAGANVVQTWYPNFWQPPPEIMVRQTRPTITHISNSAYVTVDFEEPSVRFDTLSPEFADRFGNEHRWTNVVRIHDYTLKSRLATIFPTDFRTRSTVTFGTGIDHLLSTTEGLISFPRFKDVPNHWQLVDGTQAIVQWLKGRDIIATLSESGRSAQQIIQTMRGFNSLRALANKGIVELLDSMARRPITRSAQQQEFRNKVHNAVKGDIWQDRAFELLVDRRAVQLGQELRCPKCGSWSWYDIARLSETMTCELCLREFAFPVSSPTDSKHARWAYRVIGPFALPEYAKGGYAAALAIRFFAMTLGTMQSSEITWTAGQDFSMPDGKKAEADFILWYQRKRMFGTDYPTETVFGEAKSFGKEAFKERDFERMKSLAEAFPGSILVFATMKEASELSKDEIAGLKRLALWGREYDRDRRHTRAPVVVLTGTELFTSHYVEHEWKQKGGKHAQLVGPGWVRLDHLRTLADMTQQLYLDLPSYGMWSNARWKKRRERMTEKRVEST